MIENCAVPLYVLSNASEKPLQSRKCSFLKRVKVAFSIMKVCMLTHHPRTDHPPIIEGEMGEKLLLPARSDLTSSN